MLAGLGPCSVPIGLCAVSVDVVYCNQILFLVFLFSYFVRPGSERHFFTSLFDIMGHIRKIR